MKSRLQRSYDARLRNGQDVSAFCDERKIPHGSEFDALTQPTPEMKDRFAAAYGPPALPPLGLKEKGASTILVFESKQHTQGKPEEASLHGELVAAVADHVGRSLAPGVETLYVQTSINPSYRATATNEKGEFVERQWLEPVNALMENQGVPVIHTSIGWQNEELNFRTMEKQMRELWNVTAFVVDSAGNQGSLGFNNEPASPYQKHNVVSHAPPLVVHVGATAKNADGTWHAEGYSSANSPTFLAPVAPDVKAVWRTGGTPADMIGTSVAAPYVSGVLAALNERFGAYLTREQILYALIATCGKVEQVDSFKANNADGVLVAQTPETKTLEYVTNKAGLSYNPDYAGFGVIRPELADRLLQEMVVMTQKRPRSITVPVEEQVQLDTQVAKAVTPDADGIYRYTVQMPQGIALKTTLAIEFANAHGKIHLVSPGGTRLPMIMSKLPPKEEGGHAEPFGMSTSHGWAGETLGGDWQVESTEPIQCLQMNQHHFMARDIVSQLDVNALLKAEAPKLDAARPLTDMIGIDTPWRRVHAKRVIVPYTERTTQGWTRE